MTSEPLWTGLGLVDPLGARIVGRAPAAIGGVSIDTRTLTEGDLFFAIRGDASDGHDYVAAAFQKGAAAAVVDEAHAEALKETGPLYVVRDTLRAMEALGRASRQRTGARIVAVTGSVGKTGTKEALRLVLSRQGATHASAASYNNHWGVPLTLARMPKQTAFGVFEIGMNHAGEITPLVGMVRPHVAIITTIAPVHLEFFGTLEAIAHAKAEIFSGVETGGAAIVNRDVAQFELLRESAQQAGVGRVFSFGAHEEADARLLECEISDHGSKVAARIGGRTLRFTIAAPGRHLAMNALSVLLAVRELGGDMRAAAQALGEFEAPVGRGQRVVLATADGPATLIDESYNANPTSMRAALALLAAARPGPNGRRIAVLGDMLELGPEAAALHRDLAEAITQNDVDLVFAAGPMMRGLFEALPRERRGAWAERSAGIEAALRGKVAAGDVLMVKGSNGSRMGPIVASLKQHFAPADAQRAEG